MSQSSHFQKQIDALSKIMAAFEEVEESQRQLLFETVSSYLKSNGVMPRKPIEEPFTRKIQNNETSVESEIEEECSPKEFLEIKKPGSDMERVACLAFYLTHMRKMEHFETSDIVALNKEAKESRFSNPSSTIANATRSAKFLSTVEKGKKQLTSLGERFVRALPNREAAKDVLKTKRKTPRKKKAAKKKA